jgi:hypothetical protein
MAIKGAPICQPVSCIKGAGYIFVKCIRPLYWGVAGRWAMGVAVPVLVCGHFSHHAPGTVPARPSVLGLAKSGMDDRHPRGQVPVDPRSPAARPARHINRTGFVSVILSCPLRDFFWHVRVQLSLN